MTLVPMPSGRFHVVMSFLDHGWQCGPMGGAVAGFSGGVGVQLPPPLVLSPVAAPPFFSKGDVGPWTTSSRAFFIAPGHYFLQW